MKKRDKKNKFGQVTIFIIIALIIIVLAVLIYLLYPQIKTSLGFESKNPSAIIQLCMEDEIKNNVKKLSLQGGSIDPIHYIMYKNEKIEYLCYSNEYYKPCVMQQPVLDTHIENEIKKSIERKSKECFESLKKDYEKKGYTVILRKGGMNVELLPKRIVTTFNHTLILTKGETEKYDSFRVVVHNNLYELVGITNSILDWEASYGEAETTIYMDFYHDLKVEKKKQSDGSTIYILTDRNNQNKFQFASRSVAWPPGWGIKGE